MAKILEIYLVRHAVAAERGPKYPDDRLRPLTPEGVKRFRDSVKGLNKFGVEIDQVLTSPLLRARDTATLLASALKPKPPIEEVEALAPGGRHVAIVDAIKASAKRHRRLALVGHQPDLGEFTARLLGARGSVEFRKGAICLIDVDSATPGGPGTLRWFLPPRALRAISDK